MNQPDNQLEDQERLATLWVAAQPAVSNYLSAFLPEYHARQEVIQNTAVVLVRKFSSYDSSRPFVTWVIGIARLELLKYRAKSTKLDTVTFSESIFDLIQDCCVEQVDTQGETEEALEECMEQLTARSRQLLTMRYASDLDTQQIAKQIGAKHSAVRMALFRTRKTLRSCIQQRIMAWAQSRSGGRA